MFIDNLEYKTVETKEEVESTLSFFKRDLSHYMDQKIWDWEFNTFPNTALTIVKDKNEVVGTQFMLPVVLNVNGQELMSGKSESSLFNSQYRGKGLFQKLYAYAEEVSLEKSMLFLWGFTSAVDVFEKKLKFTVPINIMYDFSIQVRMPDLSIKQSNNRLSAYKTLIYKYYKYILYKKRHSSLIHKTNYAKTILKYKVKDTVDTFEDFDKLYDSLRSKHGNFAHIKIDKSYFDWRIKNNINLKYVVNCFYLDGNLVGYYIYSIIESSANISDFTALNSEVSNVMLCHMLKKINDLKISKVAYFGNMDNEMNKNIFNLLSQLGGSVNINKGLQFVYKSISTANSNDSFLKSPKNWYLNGLWTEGFAY